MCVSKNRCRVSCVFVRPQKLLQSELCFCASAIVPGSLYMGGLRAGGKSYLGGHLGTGKSYLGSKFVPAGFLGTRGGKWYLGAGKSYLGGPRGLEIRISGVFSGPSGGKSFLGGGKSYWGAPLGTRKSYLGVGLAWKLIWGVSSGLETGT